MTPDELRNYAGIVSRALQGIFLRKTAEIQKHGDHDQSTHGNRDGGHVPSIGEKARISDNRGVNSNKEVTIVHRNEIKTDGRGIPTNIPGAYKPVDWSREVAVRFADGTYNTVPKSALRPAASEEAQRRLDEHMSAFTSDRTRSNRDPDPDSKDEQRRQEIEHEEARNMDREDRDRRMAAAEREDNERFNDAIRVYTNTPSGDMAKYLKNENGKWTVYSESGKPLGIYETEAEAKNRLRQIEYFEQVKKLIDPVRNNIGKTQGGKN